MDDRQVLLDQLHGLQTPSVSAVPALGWWLLMLFALLLGFAIWRYRKAYQHDHWHRQAMAEISAIRNSDQSCNILLTRCSALARKIALVGLPREQAAATVGKVWLQQLDELCGKPVFTTDTGKLLLEAPYQLQPDIKATDISLLSDALEQLSTAVLNRQKKHG